MDEIGKLRERYFDLLFKEAQKPILIGIIIFAIIKQIECKTVLTRSKILPAKRIKDIQDWLQVEEFRADGSLSYFLHPTPENFSWNKLIESWMRNRNYDDPERHIKSIKANLYKKNSNRYNRRLKRQAITVTQTVDGSTSTTFNITPLIYRILFEVAGPIFSQVLGGIG